MRHTKTDRERGNLLIAEQIVYDGWPNPEFVPDPEATLVSMSVSLIRLRDENNRLAAALKLARRIRIPRYPQRGEVMKTAKQLVDEINSAGDIYSPRHVAIDMPDAKEVATIDYDDRRWYVVGTIVYQIGDEFFGVRGPVILKSEEMMWEDTGEKCEAFEMYTEPSIKYIRKCAPGGRSGL